MEYLFSKYLLKHIELKNRIVMPGLASFLMDKDGSVTERAIEHYRRRAAGGPAMVIMEACAVSADGIVSRTQARIDHDRYVAGISKIAAALKSEGAVPALQIHHAGRQTSPWGISYRTTSRCCSINAPVAMTKARTRTAMMAEVVLLVPSSETGTFPAAET